MKVQIIIESHSLDIEDTRFYCEMPVIPRLGEYLTFNPDDEGNQGKVEHINYEYDDNKLKEITIWVEY